MTRTGFQRPYRTIRYKDCPSFFSDDLLDTAYRAARRISLDNTLSIRLLCKGIKCCSNLRISLQGFHACLTVNGRKNSHILPLLPLKKTHFYQCMTDHWRHLYRRMMSGVTGNMNSEGWLLLE